MILYYLCPSARNGYDRLPELDVENENGNRHNEEKRSEVRSLPVVEEETVLVERRRGVSEDSDDYNFGSFQSLGTACKGMLNTVDYSSQGQNQC